MNIKMFGHRCLVEHHKLPRSKSNLMIPDVAGEKDTHRIGIVRVVGDGIVRHKGETKEVPHVVQVGDVVMFQINQIMQATQTYIGEGRCCMNMLQGEIIARIKGDEASFENIEMVGDYVLLKSSVKKNNNLIVIPSSVSVQKNSDFIALECAKKGTSVEAPYQIGEELIVNFGRVTPLFIGVKNEDGTSKVEEYLYTTKEWVDGYVPATG